ncbi:MAG: 50S ribosomal protein L11 methyltransferase [Bacteroidales bacterium]
MNNYIQVDIIFSPFNEIFTDVTAALLGEIGFESFTVSEYGMTGYIDESLFSEEALKTTLLDLPFDTKTEYSVQTIVSQNWNEEWEKNYFQPILIENECIIHSSFHKDIPKVKYDILIDPKMSFGTGHHETTSLVIAQLLSTDVESKSLLDMGCGTAVLAILARMKGASPITAIDIDDWAVNNSKENIELNNTADIEVLLGGAELLDGKQFDIILANINRNILLNDIRHYAKCMNSGATLIMSGFYVEDIPIIEAEALVNGLIYQSHAEKNRWVAVKFTKN